MSSTIAVALVSAPSVVAESASDPSSGSVMLRSLRRDFGSQCALLRLLVTPEIARLVRSCATWGRWIRESNSALGPRRHLVKPSRFAELLSCEWVRLAVQKFGLLLETEPLVIDQGDGAEMAAIQARETQQLEFALAHLGPAFFPRLEHLGVRLRVPRLSPSVLRDCFASLAPRLQALLFELPFTEHAIPGDSTVHSLMAHVSLLSHLRYLSISGAIAAPQSVSFAELPALPQLGHFIFRVCAKSQKADVLWLPSHSQVECLGRCEQLYKLDCGSWTEDEQDRNHACSRMEMLSQAKRPRSGVLESSHCTLQKLCLDRTEISAPLWSHLAHLSTLVSLRPAGWSWSPSAAEWAPLASFNRLAQLSIGPPHAGWESPQLQSSAYLPALVRCSNLEVLTLSCTTLSAVQMQFLTRSLPKLQNLWLVFVRLPLASLACLASLPLLRKLFLEYAPLEGAFENARPHLPALAALTELYVWEPEERMLPADAVAEQNAALFARCPKLRASEFHQSLL